MASFSPALPHPRTPLTAPAYKRKLEVINKGFSGYNTAHALHVLPQLLPPPCASSRIALMVPLPSPCPHSV